MPHGPRRFAKNSENVRHFKLIARSQDDKVGEDPDASPLVLEPFVPLGEKRHAYKKGIDEEELLAIPESLQVLGPEVFGLSSRPQGIEFSSDEEEYDEDADEFAELDDDCYFPKDGYNYNKHLKKLSTDKKKLGGVVIDAPKKCWSLDKDTVDPKEIMLPKPVTTEEEEIMAALDEAELYDELGEEDLDELIPGGVLQEEALLWGESGVQNQDLPDLSVFKAMHAQRMAAEMGEDGEEYEEDGDAANGAGGPSDAQFDALLEDEYAEEADGALDDDEIEGHVDIEDMDAVLDEFIENTRAEKLKWDNLVEPQEQKLCDCPRVIDETKAIVARFYTNEDNANDDTSEGESEEDKSKDWDCETVLSTLSNVSNRPGKINKIKVVKPKAAPKDLAAIAESDGESSDDAVELPDVCTERSKDETPEEKKQRKNAVKEMRRICRKMKKESKEMYKTEAAKLAKKQGSNDVRQGLRVNKL